MILMSTKTENPLEIKEFLKWCSLLDNIISSHASSTSLSTAPDELAYYSNNLRKNQDFPAKNQLNTAMTQKLSKEAYRLGKEGGSFCDDGPDANGVQPICCAAESQCKAKKTHDEHRRQQYLLHDLFDGSTFSGICRHNDHHRNVNEPLCHIHDSHAVSLACTKQDNAERKTQHAGLMAAKEHRKIVIGKALLSGMESPKAA